MKKFSYESMGTHWEVTVWDAVEDAHLKELEKEIIEMSQIFDQTYSRFIKTSLVWKIAEKGGTYEVPPDFIHMLKMYQDLYISSAKKLNPLIGFTISDLGYDDSYSLQPKEHVRTTPDLFETVNILQEGDHLAIQTTEPVLFDFGALGKGYFVDKITAHLKAAGLSRFMVNGSGDIYFRGMEPINVGLEHPTDPTLVIGSVPMIEGAMCASGINRRKWDKYHHVIDPATSASTEEGISATWVLASTAALADALASCLFFVARESLASYSFEYVIMNNQNQIKKSPGWKGEIY